MIRSRLNQSLNKDSKTSHWSIGFSLADLILHLITFISVLSPFTWHTRFFSKWPLSAPQIKFSIVSIHLSFKNDVLSFMIQI
jgi:hypothetical protein